MRYDKIDRSLFIANRKKFIKELKTNSIAIFFSNDILPDSADAYHRFRQNPDIFWLTGIDQEETILVLYPDAPNSEWREMLFVRETNQEIAIWEGEKYTKEGATAQSGIDNVQWSQNFLKILPPLMHAAEYCYLHLNEHNRYVSEADYADRRLTSEIRQRWPLHKYERSGPIMHKLRAIKSEIEIALIKQACQITKKGFERLLKFVKPGVKEYEIEAEMIHEYVRNGSRGFAYEPIIASGFNANVLHYIANDKECKAGDILLLDCAAEYANYNSDLTRAIPVSGRYTPRQKEVYNAVLSVMRQAMDMLRPGNVLKEYNDAVGLIMQEELVKLKLLTKEDISRQDPKWPAYKKYFMHGTSHFLGLNVHDVGDHYRKFEPGMVFTCEPGIYIREESIGIRIENNIVITDGKPLDLMGDILIEADEIEERMNSHKNA
ncbi:MAG: aminopeptidase P family protein [Bacteroidota bacterium]|nr:aminopeptidase P family protein [Bacteroidota bacterium]